jgi:hypothetical protein
MNRSALRYWSTHSRGQEVVKVRANELFSRVRRRHYWETGERDIPATSAVVFPNGPLGIVANELDGNKITAPGTQSIGSGERSVLCLATVSLPAAPSLRRNRKRSALVAPSAIAWISNPLSISVAFQYRDDHVRSSKRTTPSSRYRYGDQSRKACCRNGRTRSNLA